MLTGEAEQIAGLQERKSELGDRIRELRTERRTFLQRSGLGPTSRQKWAGNLQTLIDEALAQFREAIQASNQQLALASVSLPQIIALSGSVKASINEAASLTGTGQLLISAEYGTAEQPAPIRIKDGAAAARVGR